MKHILVHRAAIQATTVALLFLAGCASEQHKEAARAHFEDENPPAFLAGPALVALKGIDGFSANVVATSSASLLGPTSPALDARTISGQVIGRSGRVIFQPWTTAIPKKGKIVKGGMFFICDLSSQSGYVLSEALQGYAPISPTVQITNVTPNNDALVSETANGHPCHRIVLTVGLSDGSIAKLTEWQADDLRRFPVRLRASVEGREETVDFSDVRLDLPAPDLFVPPPSFTKYASSMALINELMIRESGLRQGIGEPSESLQPINGAWTTH